MSDQSATLAQINRLLQSLAQGQGSSGGQGQSSSGGQSSGAGQGQSANGAWDDFSPRERLQAMMLRAYIDEDYASSVKADPTAALQKVGFSDTEARGFMQQPRGAEAVLARGSCFDTTCIISICPSSCVASIPAIPGVCTESASSNPITQVGGAILGSIFGGF
jgi:hypothetical protein